MPFIADKVALRPPRSSVCAVGNQFGLDLSVTCGVVSALHRAGTGFNPIEDFVQTDAVVNPGAFASVRIAIRTSFRIVDTQIPLWRVIRCCVPAHTT